MPRVQLAGRRGPLVERRHDSDHVCQPTQLDFCEQRRRYDKKTPPEEDQGKFVGYHHAQQLAFLTENATQGILPFEELHQHASQLSASMYVSAFSTRAIFVVLRHRRSKNSSQGTKPRAPKESAKPTGECGGIRFFGGAGARILAGGAKFALLNHEHVMNLHHPAC